MFDYNFDDFASLEHGHFGHNFGGFRAGRGTMEPVISKVLSQKPMHGYEVISTLENKSHGMWRPSAGSVYPTLQLLEEKGYIQSKESDGKKVYSLTKTGQKAAEEADQRHESAWDDHRVAFREMAQWRRSLGYSFHIMRDIFHSGSESQKANLKQAIEQFNEKIAKIAKDGHDE
jgi:DNA-binding PadR family transcriptional regulator